MNNGKPMLFGSVKDIEVAQKELLSGHMMSVATAGHLGGIVRGNSEPVKINNLQQVNQG